MCETRVLHFRFDPDSCGAMVSGLHVLPLNVPTGYTHADIEPEGGSRKQLTEVNFFSHVNSGDMELLLFCGNIHKW